MWEGEDKSPRSQEETSYADHPRAVHPAAKVADKDDEDGIAGLQRGTRDQVSARSCLPLAQRLTIFHLGRIDREGAVQH